MTPDLYLRIPALPVLPVVWAVGVSVAAIRLARGGRLTRGRLVTVLVSATYVTAVLAVTLLPLSIRLGEYANRVPWYEKVNLVLLVTIDVRTFALNIIMTVPLGLLLPLTAHVRSARRTALIGFLVSLVIELSQAGTDLLLSSGRVGDLDDLLANTAGAVAGWYLYTCLRTSRRVTPLLRALEIPRRRRPSRQRRLRSASTRASVSPDLSPAPVMESSRRPRADGDLVDDVVLAASGSPAQPADQKNESGLSRPPRT